MENHFEFLPEDGPSTLTVIPTYRCTAACEQCCFGSNPHIKERLSKEEILEAVREAKNAFPNLKQVVFSGGECVMLGEDLYAGIALASSLKLSTRIVTNGYWGASPNKAAKVARRLRESGLKELNISTGRDHAKYVSVDAVLRAAQAAVDEEMFTLITIEQDAEDSDVVAQINSNPLFIALRNLGNEKFRHQINTWMKFNDQHKDRSVGSSQVSRNNPCTQLFSNIVITPHKNIAACCGLTYEHIPEMRIGTLASTGLKAAFGEEAKDFLKIWIHIDGPDGVIRKIFDNEPPEELISKDHMCDTCARLHKSELARSKIRERYREFYPEVMLRFGMKKFIDAKITNEADKREIGGSNGT